MNLKNRWRNKKRKQIINLEEVFIPKIQKYLALSCFCQNDNELIAYFKDKDILVKKSYRTFRQLIKR